MFMLCFEWFLTQVWLILRVIMLKFIPEVHNYSYLIMAASEREERGGAIAYRGGPKNLSIGSVNIDPQSEFVYRVQRLSPSKVK